MIMARLALAGMFALTLPLQAQAQPEATLQISGCEDGVALCDPAKRASLLADYGLSEAEAEAGRGVTLRRFIVRDAWGRHLAAAVFYRKAGQAPQVEILAPEEAHEPQALRGTIGQRDWQQLIDMTANFHHRLAGELAPFEVIDGKFLICGDAPTTLVEASDQIGAWVGGVLVQEKPLVRRNSSNRCNPGLAHPIAVQMAQLAIENLPECSTVLPILDETPLRLLEICRALKGDRMAAGEVYRQLVESRFLGGVTDMRMLASSRHDLRQAFLTAVAGCRRWIDGVDAQHVDRAEVFATLFCGEGDDYSSADLRFNMIREADAFVITAFTVSERKLVPD